MAIITIIIIFFIFILFFKPLAQSQQAEDIVLKAMTVTFIRR